jgi:hypothetical protein
MNPRFYPDHTSTNFNILGIFRLCITEDRVFPSRIRFNHGIDVKDPLSASQRAGLWVAILEADCPANHRRRRGAFIDQVQTPRRLPRWTKKLDQRYHHYPTKQ